MKRPAKACIMFEHTLALSGIARHAHWLSLTDSERDITQQYCARRLDLRDVYGEGAASMQAREDRLAWLRADEPGLKASEKLAWLRRYYGSTADAMADFIDDWGFTNDPRLIADGRNPVVAFHLFPRQREMVRWMLTCWIDNKPGIVVKSRDVGASWVAMALLCTLCIFRNGFAAGVGSALEVKIDRTGDPDTLFFKIRSFLEYLPPEFNGGFDLARCSADKRVSFPLTGSSITGSAGDQAFRGGRGAIAIVDEAAHFEHPKILDKSLSAYTRCRIDMSSVNGMANSFATRAHNAAIRRFDFTWRDDPRKDQAWYEQQCAEYDEVVVKQEIDCDFTAALVGTIIPRAWAEAAVDIDKHLGIDMSSGARRAALDIADRGNDLNAVAVVEGRRLTFVEQWSGKGSDTGYSVQRAFGIVEAHGLTALDYDADGMGGAAVHSDARLINEARAEVQSTMKDAESYFKHGTIATHAYRGSEAVLRPEQIVPGTKRKAKDLFANRKAQTWYAGRLGCYHAWRARQGLSYDPNLMICIAGDLADSKGTKLRDLLLSQLAQATIKETLTGKIQVDKNPDDVSSPDLADAALMAWAPRRSSMTNMGAILATVQGNVMPGRR